MKLLSINFLLVLALFSIFGTMDNNYVKYEKKYSEQWVASQTFIYYANNGFTYNGSPNKGERHFTYSKIFRKSVDAGNGKIFNFIVGDNPGNNKITADKFTLDQKTKNGKVIYTAQYANQFVNYAETYIDQKISDGIITGAETHKDKLNEYLIYRKLSWSTDTVTRRNKSEISFETYKLTEIK